jgi:5-methylcytosine-specific restriction endonuclease McrA
LTDAALLSRLEALVSQERGGTADLIEHLAEVDRREIVIDAGHPSLFEYCVKVLRYSEAAAFLRIRAARAAAKYPRILVDLRSGTIHLDAVMRLYPHLSEENSDTLLNQASGASKREVLALVATLEVGAPAPERDVVRWLPPKLPPRAEGAEPASIIPPSRVRLGFTADDELFRLLERLRSLRRHKYPEGRLEDLLKDAVEALLHQLDPCLKTSRSRTRKPIVAAKPGRRVTAAVKAAVWNRDGGCCAYAAPNGRRCEARDFLEYDHIVPWALGGLSTLDNIRLLCRAHNQRLAKRRFGPRRRSSRVHVRPDAVEHGQ